MSEYDIERPYIVFWGSVYYPGGGFDDKHEFFLNEEQSIQFAKLIVEQDKKYTWAHVYDVCQRSMIYNSRRL